MKYIDILRSIRVKTQTTHTYTHTHTHTHPPTHIMAPKNSTRPLDMPLATWVANTHADIAERTAAAEAKLTSKPAAAPAEVKAKRPPTEWIVFCGRVRALLLANEMPIKSGVRESTKFCSSLKAQKAYSMWTDEAILEARSAWVTPPPSNTASDSEAPVAVVAPVVAPVVVAPVAEVKEKKPVKPRAKKTA